MYLANNRYSTPIKTSASMAESLYFLYHCVNIFHDPALCPKTPLKVIKIINKSAYKFDVIIGTYSKWFL